MKKEQSNDWGPNLCLDTPRHWSLRRSRFAGPEMGTALIVIMFIVIVRNVIMLIVMIVNVIMSLSFLSLSACRYHYVIFIMSLSLLLWQCHNCHDLHLRVLSLSWIVVVTIVLLIFIVVVVCVCVLSLSILLFVCIVCFVILVILLHYLKWALLLLCSLRRVVIAIISWRYCYCYCWCYCYCSFA